MNMHSILREALALLLLMLVLVTALSIYSFTPQDPSFNHETSAAAVNQAGIVGAYIADFFYQLFGYVSWIIILLGMALVVRIAFGFHPFAGGWTTLFWLPCLLGLAGLMSAHADLLSRPDQTALPAGAGGAFGALLSEGLLSTLHTIGRDLVLIAVVLS